MLKARKAVVAAAALFGAAAVPVSAQTVEQVLERYQAAIGGTEGWAALQTMKASGTLDVMGGAMTGPFTIVQKRPAMARIEVTVQGMTIVQAYDGETAWQIMPMTGSTEPQVADPVTAASIIDQADLDGPLIGWKEAGTQIALAGTETVDGAETTKLEVTLKTGDVLDYYLDERYLPIRVVALRTAQGGEGETTTTLADYREVGGLMFPYRIQVETPMGPQTLTFESIEVNVPVDEALFSMSGH